jgi:hypothetical protein
MGNEEGIKRNIIDMLWIITGTLTANSLLAGTKIGFTRVLVALKTMQIS